MARERCLHLHQSAVCLPRQACCPACHCHSAYDSCLKPASILGHSAAAKQVHAGPLSSEIDTDLHVSVQAKGIRGGAGASKTVSQEQHEVQGSEGSTSSTGSSRRKGPKASESRNPKKARKMRRSETSMPRDTEVHETLSADSYDRFQAQEGGDSHRWAGE